MENENSRKTQVSAVAIPPSAVCLKLLALEVVNAACQATHCPNAAGHHHLHSCFPKHNDMGPAESQMVACHKLPLTFLGNLQNAGLRLIIEIMLQAIILNVLGTTK